jgi:hypothetical protein
MTDIVKNVKTQDISSGMVNSCKISVYLEPTASAEPGYYAIELISKWVSFGKREFKYLRGGSIEPVSWDISGGETWLALGRGENLRDIFHINISYSPFTPSIPVFTGTPPTPIENAVFVLINNYRVRAGTTTLKWDQTIQDDARMKALTMLQEGKVSYAPLQPPYAAQLIYSSNTYTGEPPENIARKAFDSWLRDNNQNQYIT